MSELSGFFGFTIETIVSQARVAVQGLNRKSRGQESSKVISACKAAVRMQ